VERAHGRGRAGLPRFALRCRAPLREKASIGLDDYDYAYPASRSSNGGACDISGSIQTDGLSSSEPRVSAVLADIRTLRRGHEVVVQTKEDQLTGENNVPYFLRTRSLDAMREVACRNGRLTALARRSPFRYRLAITCQRKGWKS
jgi:hypothetical protein